jgi:hypothetical protein
MTPDIIIAVSILVVVGALFTIRLVARSGSGQRPFDAGVVSTRWLAELKRDEPWSR